MPCPTYKQRAPDWRRPTKEVKHFTVNSRRAGISERYQGHRGQCIVFGGAGDAGDAGLMGDRRHE